MRAGVSMTKGWVGLAGWGWVGVKAGRLGLGNGVPGLGGGGFRVGWVGWGLGWVGAFKSCVRGVC